MLRRFRLFLARIALGKADYEFIARHRNLRKKNMKTVLLSFEDEAQRDDFLAAMRKVESEVVKNSLSSIVLDPSIRDENERHCAVFVTGQKIIEGKFADMSLRFDQETSSHSGSVLLKELVQGEWKTIRTRRK